MKFLRCIILLFFCIISWQYPIAQEIRHNQNHLLFSQHLGEKRIIQIHLPQSYWSTNKAYPVLFVLDGEYVFNYAKGAADFLSNDFGFHPEMIIVGIPNTDRNRDLFVDLKSDGTYLNFVDFLKEELLPLIDKNYRTNSFKILYGWSSGSGLANYIFVENPNLFNGYILSGAGIGSKTALLIKNNLNPDAYKDIHLFVSSEGTTARSSALQKHKTLIEQIKPKGLHWRFKVYNQLNHVDVMSQGLYHGLQFVFKDFHIPDSIILKGSKAIINFYQKLEKKYQFRIDIPIGAINETCAILVQQNKVKEAFQLLEYGLNVHSNNSTLLATMGEVYRLKNQPKLAAKYYLQAAEEETDSIKINKYNVLYKSISGVFNPE